MEDIKELILILALGLMSAFVSLSIVLGLIWVVSKALNIFL